MLPRVTGDIFCIWTTQDLIRDELQSSFKQRSEQTIQRKQQELEEQLFKRTMNAVQEVDVDSQRVSHSFNHSVSQSVSQSHL